MLINKGKYLHLDEGSAMERRAAMTWAQRLRRVFKIDIETCEACGGTVKVIASIKDPMVIEKISTHLSVTTHLTTCDVFHKT